MSENIEMQLFRAYEALSEEERILKWGAMYAVYQKSNSGLTHDLFHEMFREHVSCKILEDLEYLLARDHGDYTMQLMRLLTYDAQFNIPKLKRLDGLFKGEHPWEEAIVADVAFHGDACYLTILIAKNGKTINTITIDLTDETFVIRYPESENLNQEIIDTMRGLDFRDT
jgi:hypothetical protein